MGGDIRGVIAVRWEMFGIRSIPPEPQGGEYRKPRQ